MTGLCTDQPRGLQWAQAFLEEVKQVKRLDIISDKGLKKLEYFPSDHITY